MGDLVYIININIIISIVVVIYSVCNSSVINSGCIRIIRLEFVI